MEGREKNEQHGVILNKGNRVTEKEKVERRGWRLEKKRVEVGGGEGGGWRRRGWRLEGERVKVGGGEDGVGGGEDGGWRRDQVW